MTEQTGAQAIIETARLSTEPHEVEPGHLYVVPTAHGHTVVNLQGDEYREFPQHKRAAVTVTDVASFAHYYGKHADDWSEVFADADQTSITAVLDAHMDESMGARWQQHRLVLQLAATPEWADWAGCDRKQMAQSVFAEFIEDHLADIASDDKAPCTAADLLEMAQQFQAHSKIEFKQGHRLSSGQAQFEYVETIEAKAGERGTITIPTAFELGIRIFDDLDPYRVKARFRYRVNDGKLTLGYHLDAPERKVRDAVGLVVAKAAAATKATIMLGRP